MISAKSFPTGYAFTVLHSRQLKLFEMIGIVVTNAVGADTSASVLAEKSILSLVGEVKMLTLFRRGDAPVIRYAVDKARFETHDCLRYCQLVLCWFLAISEDE